MQQLVDSLRFGSPRRLPAISIAYETENTSIFTLDRWTRYVPARTFLGTRNSMRDMDKARTLFSQRDWDWASRMDEGRDEWSLKPKPADYNTVYEIWDWLEHDEEGPLEKWLRTKDGEPIVVAILDYLDLPPCESAHVQPLLDLARRRREVPRHHPEKQVLDDEYMVDVCDALRYWMEGERAGFALPERSSIFL